MKSILRYLVTLVVGISIGISSYVWLYPKAKQFFDKARETKKKETAARVVNPTPTLPPHKDHYPVPPEPPQGGFFTGSKPPVPDLEKSDSVVRQQIETLFGSKAVSLFVRKNLIRRIVIAVDNGTLRPQPPQEFLPLKLLKPGFVVTHNGEERTLSRYNFDRYQPFVSFVQTADLPKVVEFYVHFYSLFQEAYKELGTQGYFNDRLIDVIDSVLKTPEPRGPIHVMRFPPHYKYKFVDADLEMLPYPQKLLLRMGKKNAQVIKARLRELRGLLTHLDKSGNPLR